MNLSRNSISTDGLIALAEAIKINKSINSNQFRQLDQYLLEHLYLQSALLVIQLEILKISKSNSF